MMQVSRCTRPPAHSCTCCWASRGLISRGRRQWDGRPLGRGIAAVNEDFARGAVELGAVVELVVQQAGSEAEAGPQLQYLEVTGGWDAATQSYQVLWKGQELQLQVVTGTGDGPDGSSSLKLVQTGVGVPAADSVTVTTFRELASVLPAMHSHAGVAPAVVSSARVVASLDKLLEEVAADPAFWCDGTPPDGPLRTELQLALFTAGELAALMQGQRGVVLVQLFNGWDAEKGQPIYSPFALKMLERALAAPGINAVSSVAPGGVGLTAVLYADREPFASWAHHLASFGCQSNIVAGSAYYKLLIGLLLGYKLPYVLGYLAASGEPASQQLQRQVAADIRQLSKVKPKLPWSVNDTNIRKAKVQGIIKPAAAAASTATAAAAAASQ